MAIPTRLRLASWILRRYAFRKGSIRLTLLLLAGFSEWPETASFQFRFGRFVDAPMEPWPYGYRELFLSGIMESTEISIWKQVLKNGDIVVDGGANFGYWSLVAAWFVGRSGLVHAFEPVPSTCEKLQANLRASGVERVITHQVALSDHNGQSSINVAVDDPISGGSSLMPYDGMPLTKQVVCDLVALDSVLDERPIRLLKLDVEGAELSALRGARRLLNCNKKPVITFEWNRRTARSFGYEPQAVQEFVEGYGYSLFLATKEGLVPFREPRRENLDEWIPMVWALTQDHQNELGIGN